MNDKQKAIARVLAEHMDQDCIRPGRIRDEQDGAAAARTLVCIVVALLSFVVAVVWWSPS